MSNKKGIAIITSIVIVLVLSIVVLGIVSFASNGIYLNTARAATGTALAAAQAGVYAAIVYYRGHTTSMNSVRNIDVSPGVTPMVSSYNYGISTANSANNLLLDAAHTQFAPGGGINRQIQRIGHSNISASTLTIYRVRVEWQNFAGNPSLTQIYLCGASRWTGAQNVSGTIITLSSPYCPLVASTSYTVATQNYYLFSIAIPRDAVIIVTYYFSLTDDTNSRRAIIYNYNAGFGGNNEFSIRSTGMRTIGNDVSRQTIEATYNIDAGRITSWEDSQNHIRT